MIIEIRRTCPACGSPMRVVDGSQRTTRLAVYYDLECPNCLLRFSGEKPRRAKRTE